MKNRLQLAVSDKKSDEAVIKCDNSNTGNLFPLFFPTVTNLHRKPQTNKQITE